jgi:capsule polysaccharide export protein KpsC/LpsZ
VIQYPDYEKPDGLVLYGTASLSTKSLPLARKQEAFLILEFGFLASLGIGKLGNCNFKISQSQNFKI